MSFVHLHTHSEYSLLDGFSNIKKLVARAKELGMPALALTDHGTMFGVIDFYNAARAAGIKPIIGVEAYLAPRGMQARDPQLDKKSTHILLIAENQEGYSNLLKISSAAQLNGFYYYPRIDHELLAQHSKGLICTSGCMSAEVPRLIQNGDNDGARRLLDWYYETFGKEHFFLELQQHDIPELENINKNLLDLGRRYDARFVATNDVHYVNREDARLQDILLAIQTGCLLKDPNRMRMTDNSYYLRSAQEMEALFAGVPDALQNTLLIAERCEVDLGFKGYHLPQFPVPEGDTAETYLRRLCEAGLRRRYGARADDPVVRQRLEYELGVIHTMGFDAYFLIVWDLCRFAREQGIWYNARGSAAGSIVAYTLDITLVDPIDHKLIFERFLNPGRISMPDIDLDFRDDLRYKMLEYTAHKYGDDKVAQIITFGTMGARAAIRDVGRVMDIPLSDVDRVAKLIPNIPGKAVTIQQALEEITEFKEAVQGQPQLKELVETASKMEGAVRNAGTHAAGVIIADKPIVEYLPLHRPTGSSAEDSPIKTVSQFEMNILDSLGMLKVDFLGLATLTIMARACDLICQRHGIEFNLNNIPTDDPATYELLGRGDTLGVFQVEGSGMRRYLMQMKPKELANVIAMVALFRPGPMDFIPGYIRRMHGEEEVQYRHPDLEPIFKETYGYPVYQEQLMFAAMELAGYTASEADDLRKAIAKKIKDKLLKHREKFINGSEKKGVPREKATAIFDDWEEFARYGFNKCLPGDVQVIDAATGRLVTIESIFNGKAAVQYTLSCDLQTLQLRTSRVATASFNGIKPVFCLVTASGREIQATANHPFYTHAGWRTLETLQPGDLLAVPRCLPVGGAAEWPDFQVIALGHLLAGDNPGHTYAFDFYTWERAQVDDFVQAAEQFANAHGSVSNPQGIVSACVRPQDRHFPSKMVVWAQELGIWGRTASEKEIPAAAFELSHRQIGLLLSRMWEQAGQIDLNGQSLLYATASKRMAHQLQHLLLRLGILAQIRKGTFLHQEERAGYQVFVTRRTSLAAFERQVGCFLISLERREALHSLAAGSSGQCTPDLPVPGSQGWVCSAGFNGLPLTCLVEYGEDEALLCSAPGDLYWDRIVAIEYAGDRPTYDLEVPGDHNFIANDILVHNSHAADYGVISVQTAYLKTHYTVEYMTALLSVTKNETDKVALYVADTRRMGISVERPDINASQWDFSIEDRQQEGKTQAVIRFGLGAVKNVGQGPVDEILRARASGMFVDLNDFARRTDLRKVGKRALECLVKVGALDQFGPRVALLEMLDRILSLSASQFRAAEAGQMSLFGAHTGVVENISLPRTTSDISRREVLNWERELIGLYVSDHPLSTVMEVLNQAVTHFSGQLAEVGSNEKVRVAGLITRVRHHQSKAGKPMGFVTIEDVQGSIELVIFPKTWDKVAGLIEMDKIILVDGKVDAEGAEPKVLVDAITTEFSMTVSAQYSPSGRDPALVGETLGKGPGREAPTPAAPRLTPAGAAPLVGPPLVRLQQPADWSGPPSPEAWDMDMPAQPEAFAPDWEKLANHPPFDAFSDDLPLESPDSRHLRETPADGYTPDSTSRPAAEAVLSAPLAANSNPPLLDLPANETLAPASVPPEVPPVVSVAPSAGTLNMPEPVPSVLAAQAGVSAPSGADLEPPDPTSRPLPVPPGQGDEPAGTLPLAVPEMHRPESALPVLPLLVPPVQTGEAGPLRMITIVMRSTGDKVRDVLRLRRIHGILTSYPGSDRFAFLVYERGRGYRLEFPNFTAGICPEMLSRVHLLVGADNVQIETITFQ